MGFDIDALCDEIEKIYEDLLKLEIKDPSGEKKQLLDQKKLNFSINPSWLKSKGSSVRDCVLEGYGSDPKRGMVCKTSAIYTTQVSTLDIDHFVRHEAAEVNCFYGQEPRRNLLFRQQFSTQTCDRSNLVV